MQQEKNISKLNRRIAALEAELVGMPDGAQGGDALPDAAHRRRVEQLAHLFCILYMMNRKQENAAAMEKYVGLAQRWLKRVAAGGQLRTAREQAAFVREQVSVLLIDQYMRAWMTTQCYYERAGKQLCQMLVSITDELLGRASGVSVLYPDGRPENAMSCTAELFSLREELRKSVLYLAAFDFCVERMGEYLKMPEYRLLLPQTERLWENGLPARVEVGLARLGTPELSLPFFDRSLPREAMLACWAKMLDERREDEVVLNLVNAVQTVYIALLKGK